MVGLTELIECSAVPCYLELIYKLTTEMMKAEDLVAVLKAWGRLQALQLTAIYRSCH